MSVGQSIVEFKCLQRGRPARLLNLAKRLGSPDASLSPRRGKTGVSGRIVRIRLDGAFIVCDRLLEIVLVQFPAMIAALKICFVSCRHYPARLIEAPGF